MNFKKIGATLLAMSMAAALAVAPATASKAATVGGGNDTVVYTNSFANRDTDANPLTEDESKVQASENLARHNLPTTVTINPKKTETILDDFSVYSYTNAAQAVDSTVKDYVGIKDVTSSSSNLKIKINGESYSSSYDEKSYNPGYTDEIYLYAYAKKAGTYTIKYNLTYRDSNYDIQTEERSIKVIAKEYKPFTKVTFAGKSLWYDKNTKSKYIYKTNDFTTKKSGKLVVKAAKGFKINKIEVGTLENKTISAADYFTNEDEYYENTDSTTYTYSGTAITHKSYKDYYVNGNIAYDEFGNVISRKWTTVKSGKTIKLSTVISNTYSKINCTRTSTTTNDDTTVTNRNTTYKANYRKGALAPTTIKITYTDTRTGEVHQWTKTINKLIKK